ncbi:MULTISPECIES: T6SS effector BTH_I2691 family protein [unclassified Variovorax]|uniref:T6SS effector BTH_I2691 family protein n=1 Tax=unclassified Variovorax TaxID=663243 RepID=UPI003F475802
MPHATPCDQCSQTGLPILFTRYAAAYSASQSGMDALDTLKTNGTLKRRPSGVTLKAARCNLRMLRAGYLYLRLETEIRHPEWLGYAVHPHGYLTRIDIDHPENASAEPACRPNEWGANRSLVWIKDVDAITRLHFMFHPDPVDPEHLKKVIGKEPKRYMQSFDVAGWAKGKVNQDDTMLPDSLDIMVMEFKALSDETLQTVGCEQHYGLMGSGVERQWGAHTEVKYGRHVSEGYRTDNIGPDPHDHYPMGTGPVGPARTGAYLHETVDLPYRIAHGPRLEKITKYLKAHKGAVLACEDPVGVAQELALHHLTAAIPYVAWLKEVDGADSRNPKVNNQWKQAASESIKTMEAAFQKRAMGLYDESTQKLQAMRAELEHRSRSAPAQMHERQADGTYKEVFGKVFAQNRIREIDERIAARAARRDTVSSAEALDAVVKTAANHDAGKRAKFDAAHARQLKERNDAMDKLTEDLIACICHKSFYEQTLGRYRSDQRGLDTGDGLRCAAQLCVVLSPMDSSPRGRKWYASLDLFEPDPRTLSGAW